MLAGLGGADDDTYMIDHAGDTVSETVDAGTDTVLSTFTWILGANVENLALISAKALSGTGNALDNRITGNGAANALSGLAGNDRLIGGAGRDTLTGGADADTLIFESPADAIDRILDFTASEDLLEFLAAGFGGNLVAGSTPEVVNAAKAAAVSLPVTATDGYFIFDNAGANMGWLYWDATGGGGADAVAVARLPGVTSLAASDFQIV